jgi:hypothetical protein
MCIIVLGLRASLHKLPVHDRVRFVLLALELLSHVSDFSSCVPRRLLSLQLIIRVIVR